MGGRQEREFSSGEKIGIGLVLNAAYRMTALGGVAALPAWALIEYGLLARPMRSRSRGSAEATGKDASRSEAGRTAPAAPPAEGA